MLKLLLADFGLDEIKRFLFAKDDDSIAVRATSVVTHAPTISGLGEGLAINQSVCNFKASGLPGEDDLLFQH